MAKNSLYGMFVEEVTPLGYSKQGNQRYEITVSDATGTKFSRKVRKDITANYEAKRLGYGDKVDLITDGRGSVIAIEVKA